MSIVKETAEKVQKKRYKAFYDNFYKGVKEKNLRELKEFKRNRDIAISISILITKI
jgi:hypothetical protein